MGEIHKYKFFNRVDADFWELKHDLVVNVGPFHSVTLKKGFRTNFASIPTWPERLKRLQLVGWIFRILDPHRLIDPDDDSIAIPAACHDGWVGEFSEYVTITYRIPVPGAPNIEIVPGWDRAANDLKKLMFGFRAKPWKRFIVYWAVKYYGTYKRIVYGEA